MLDLMNLVAFCYYRPMRRPKRKIFLFLLVFLLLSIPLFSLAGDPFTAKILGVSNADTIKVMREG